MKIKIIVLIAVLGLVAYGFYTFSWIYGFAKGELEDTRTKKFELIPFHFTDEDVDSIQLIEVEHPLLGDVISSNLLPIEKNKDFINFINTSNPVGLNKVYTCFNIQVKLKDGNIKRYRTNGHLISSESGDNFYRLKSNTILNFFGKTDTINCDIDKK